MCGLLKNCSVQIVIQYIPVSGDSAVIRLGGNAGDINGPTTRVGIILMNCMLFSSAACHAAFSANDFDTKYICDIFMRNCYSYVDKLLRVVAGVPGSEFTNPGSHLCGVDEIHVTPVGFIVHWKLMLTNVHSSGRRSVNQFLDCLCFSTGLNDVEDSLYGRLDNFVL